MSATDIQNAIDDLLTKLHGLDHDDNYDTTTATRIIMSVRDLQRMGGYEPSPLFRLV